MTMHSLEIAQQLQRVTVWMLPCCTSRRSIRSTRGPSSEIRRLGRLVVVAENHSVIGGLGEAVASLLMRSGVAPTLRQICLPDASVASA